MSRKEVRDRLAGIIRDMHALANSIDGNKAGMDVVVSELLYHADELEGVSP